jgi:uncharacterized membrane protein
LLRKVQAMNSLNQLSPSILIHLFAALSALAIGPLALWARLGTRQRPRLHRAFGYAWVTLMVATAVSAMFIRTYRIPNIAGYNWIHLFVPLTALGLYSAFRYLALGNIDAHRKSMIGIYVGACIIAGGFALSPGRFLGNLVWGQWLGFI